MLANVAPAFHHYVALSRGNHSRDGGGGADSQANSYTVDIALSTSAIQGKLEILFKLIKCSSHTTQNVQCSAFILVTAPRELLLLIKISVQNLSKFHSMY